LRVRVLCLGRARNEFIRQGIDEYVKRIRPMCGLEVLEVRRPSRRRTGRGTRNLENELLTLSRGFFTVALDPSGEMLSTPELAEVFEQHSDIAIIIGDPYGLPEELVRKCDLRLSLSRLTFTSELARLVIMEQIYRVLTIMAQHPYHK